MEQALHGKSCTLALLAIPPNCDRGIIGIAEGPLQVTAGEVRLQPAGAVAIVLPPHLLDGIEPVTEELCERLELGMHTELCLRAYYNGRRRFKTFGWPATLDLSVTADRVA